MRQEFPSALDRIADADKVIGFRNVLVHGYDVIDDSTVWSAIKENLPSLLQEIGQLGKA